MFENKTLKRRVKENFENLIRYYTRNNNKCLNIDNKKVDVEKHVKLFKKWQSHFDIGGGLSQSSKIIKGRVKKNDRLSNVSQIINLRTKDVSPKMN